MKKTFLKTLYNCMNAPDDSELVNDERYVELNKKLKNCEFIKSLSEEQKVLFEKYCELETSLDAVTEEISFARGFKLGLHAGLECSKPQELIEKCRL